MRTQIIIPCYNEEKRFNGSAFDAFLDSNTEVGFVFVNDGSVDGTLRVLMNLRDRWPAHVSVINQQPNLGKAEAVRAGILHVLEQGGAQYVGYFDADLATPLDAIDDFIHTLDGTTESDFIVGARVALLGRFIDRKAHRHYLGRVFATAASVVLALPIYDTQCGAKIFRVNPSLNELFQQPFGSRWIFDVELIARYLVKKGSSAGIFELPLKRWTDVGDSRVKGSDFLRAASELAAIYRKYFITRDKKRLLTFLTAPLLRYVGAGGIGTALHYATLATAVEFVAIAPEKATVIGATVGAFTNYILNYHVTFASKMPHRKALPKFLVVAALGAVLNGLGMWYLTKKFNVHYLIAQLVCTAIVLLTGFVINRSWTFGDSRNSTK